MRSFIMSRHLKKKSSSISYIICLEFSSTNVFLEIDAVAELSAMNLLATIVQTNARNYRDY